MFDEDGVELPPDDVPTLSAHGLGFCFVCDALEFLAIVVPGERAGAPVAFFGDFVPTGRWAFGGMLRRAGQFVLGRAPCEVRLLKIAGGRRQVA